MKITKSKLIYNLIVNFFVCFFLCLTSSLLGGININWANFGINFAISYGIAMIIGLFFPLMRFGKWFTSLFSVDTTTYTNNIAYRLLATLSSTFIFFIGINPMLTVVNYFLLNQTDLMKCFYSWLLNIPLMFFVGFVTTLISDYPTYKIVSKIYKDF